MAHILVVEDERDIAEAMVMLLRLEGYSVAWADSGSSALERLRRGPLPQLILLDLTMPVMDGTEFLRRQLADSRISDIPVIILTANAAIRGADEPAVRAVFNKPVEIAELLRAVARFVSREEG